MQRFQNFIRLYQTLYILSKFQILYPIPKKFKIPFSIKLLGILVMTLFAPIQLFKKPKNFGHRLKLAFTNLGPVYIKFGQILSVRPDLVGNDIAMDLKNLQDRLPKFDNAKAIIEDNLKNSVDKLFKNFHEDPVAAASISQVHKAQLPSEEYVAIKILRPSIRKIYSKDIKMLKWIVNVVSRRLPQLKLLNISAVIDILHEVMNHELNLKLEAAACTQMSENFADNNDIYFPKVYWDLTNENILVTEWIEGTSIYDTEDLIEQGFDLKELSKKIAMMSFQQTYQDGFFHADLHPGNILVRKDGSIALLDFGIIGILSDRDRLAVAEIIYGFISRDYNLVAKIHLRVGYIPENTNLYLFAQTCRAIGERIFGRSVKDVSIGNLLIELFKVTEEFGMSVQPQLILLQKNIIIIEGIGQTLNPDINMWKLIEPWIKKWGIKNLSFEVKLFRYFKEFCSKILNDI